MGVMIALGAGRGQRLKFVVLPLNALMLMDNLDSASTQEKWGLKDILYVVKIFYFYTLRKNQRNE
jgi:hypothetical protein